MKNSLNDLNNHLFAQMERLSDESLKGDELREEIDRSKAVTSVSGQIIQNARTLLEAAEIYGKMRPEEAPEVLMVGKK